MKPMDYELMTSELEAVLEKYDYKISAIEVRKKYSDFIVIEIEAGKNKEKVTKRCDGYRKRGVKWTIDEVPVKWTRLKGYMYDCELCEKEFTTTYKIHIPWCEECRLKNIRKMKEGF